MFLATYGDGLTDAPLPNMISAFQQSGKTAQFLSVRPNFNAHLVSTDVDGNVTAVEDMSRSDLRINGGFFVFRREIFDHIREGEGLVREPFQRLVRLGRLRAHSYDGFWMSMDTFKDRQQLEEIYSLGRAPWQVWHSDVAPHACVESYA